jgi:hypothetical protein
VSKKKLELDPQQILAWMKGNIILVVLIIACIGAGVGLPMFAASWSEEVQQSLNKRTKAFSEIDALLKSKVTPLSGGSAKQVVINRELVDAYRKVANLLRDDAQKVVEQAKQHNQKDYTTLFPDLFNEDVTRSQLETLPQQFYLQLQANYRSLLSNLRAGSPLELDTLVQELEESRVRFIENKLSKDPEKAQLTQEQNSQLEISMTDKRMSMLRGRAQELGLYLDEETLDVPEFEEKNRPNMGTLFTWQWRYWAVADALTAVAVMNGEQTELTSPVKRITLVQVFGLPSIDGKNKPERSDPIPEVNERPSGPKRGGGAMGLGGDTSKNPPKKGPDKPKRDKGKKSSSRNDNGEVKSFTKREDSTLFDVLQVRLRMVVSTVRIPTILDTFAQHNFATVIDIDLQPVNKFTSLEEGFDYGAEPVSELTVVLETVWLRAWTAELMPKSVKTALGI